jgi:hypothetical protein
MYQRIGRAAALAALLTLTLCGCGRKPEYRKVEVHDEVHEGPVVEQSRGEMIVE